MLLEIFLRSSWIFLLLLSCGSAYPFQQKVQTGGGSDAGSGLGSWYLYGSGAAGGGLSESDSDSGVGTTSGGPGFPIFQSFPWKDGFVVVPQASDINELRLPQFPVPNPWENPNEVPVGSVRMPLVPPSSHIVQTSNGHLRARAVLAHTKYSMDDVPVFPFQSGQDQDGIKGWK